MRRSWLTVVPVGVLLRPIAGCSDDAKTMSGSKDQRFVTTDESSQVTEVVKRLSARDTSGTELEGKDLTLSEVAGAVTVAQGCGDWRAPCRAEAPVTTYSPWAPLVDQVAAEC